MEDFLSFHSERYTEGFAEDVDKFRANDDISKFLEIAFIELAKMRPENIKYLGCSIENKIIKNNEVQQGKASRQIKKHDTILHCKDTFAKLVIYRFELTVAPPRGDQTVKQTVIQEFPIFIPLLIDKYHYKIRGNKYAAPLQIADALFYSNQGNLAIFKTITRAIQVSRAPYTLVDIYGNEYKTFNYFINIVSKKKSPLILFYFGSKGFEETFQFFTADPYVKLVNFEMHDIPELPRNKIFFKFGQHYLEVDKEMFEKCSQLRQFIACVVSVSKRNMTYQTMQNKEEWLNILGDQLLRINSIPRGYNMLKTFENSLDYNTQSLIARIYEKGSHRKTMYHVMKWVLFDFSDITSKTPTNLANKRIRLGEYIISPVVVYIMKKLFKFINKQANSQDMKPLQDIFKMNPQILIHAIIGKTKTTEMNLNILKYSEYTNDNACLLANLPATIAGPGSANQGSKTSNVSVIQRKFDISHVGNVGLIETANSSPGLNLYLTPFTKIDQDTGTFLHTSYADYVKLIKEGKKHKKK